MNDELGPWTEIGILLAFLFVAFALTAPLRIYFGARRIQKLDRELESLQAHQDASRVPPPLPPQ